MNNDMTAYLQKIRDGERRELKDPIRTEIEKKTAEFLASGNKVTVVGSKERSQSARLFW